MTTIQYFGSKGPVAIATMPYPHLKNALGKLEREQPHRQGEIEAMRARAAELEAEQVDGAAPVGHNNPPPASAEPLTFDEIRARVAELMDEAQRWTGLELVNQEQADQVAGLMDKFRKVAKEADDLRVVENEPFDTGKAAVQAKYAPLIADTKTAKGFVPIALKALKDVLTPWLQKLEDAQKAKAAEAQRVADETAKKAVEAQKAAESGDLVAAVEAEELGQAAAVAFDTAKQAEGVKAHAHGGARATGLRSYWTPSLTDPKEALLHYLKSRPDDIRAFLLEMAETDIKAGIHAIPGFRIDEERRVA